MAERSTGNRGRAVKCRASRERKFDFSDGRTATACISLSRAQKLGVNSPRLMALKIHEAIPNKKVEKTIPARSHGKTISRRTEIIPGSVDDRLAQTFHGRHTG